MKKFYEDNEVTGQAAGIVVFPRANREEPRFEVRQRAHAVLDALQAYNALLEELPAEIEPLDLHKLDTEVYLLTAKISRRTSEMAGELDGWERRREDRRRSGRGR